MPCTPTRILRHYKTPVSGLPSEVAELPRCRAPHHETGRFLPRRGRTAARKIAQLEYAVLKVLPWIATIDKFSIGRVLNQYSRGTDPKLTSITGIQFNHHRSFPDLKNIPAHLWYKQLHFVVPFLRYRIRHRPVRACIALWKQYRKTPGGRGQLPQRIETGLYQKTSGNLPYGGHRIQLLARVRPANAGFC